MRCCRQSSSQQHTCHQYYTYCNVQRAKIWGSCHKDLPYTLYLLLKCPGCSLLAIFSQCHSWLHIRLHRSPRWGCHGHMGSLFRAPQLDAVKRRRGLCLLFGGDVLHAGTGRTHPTKSHWSTPVESVHNLSTTWRCLQQSAWDASWILSEATRFFADSSMLGYRSCLVAVFVSSGILDCLARSSSKGL